MLQKSGVQGQRHEDLKFVCVDLDLEKFSVLDAVGTMQREIVFVRENRNHFIPVLPSEIPREMLLPWNTDIGFIQAQRRKKKEAAELAERRKREEAAAAKKRKAEQEAAAAAEAEKRRKAEAAAAEETPALGDDIFSLNGIDVGQVGQKSISASKAAAAEVEKLRRQKLGLDVGEVVKNSTSASNEDAATVKRSKAEEAAAEETPALGDDLFSLNGIDVGQVGKKSISGSNEPGDDLFTLNGIDLSLIHI